MPAGLTGILLIVLAAPASRTPQWPWHDHTGSCPVAKATTVRLEYRPIPGRARRTGVFVVTWCDDNQEADSYYFAHFGPSKLDEVLGGKGSAPYLQDWYHMQQVGRELDVRESMACP